MNSMLLLHGMELGKVIAPVYGVTTASSHATNIAANGSGSASRWLSPTSINSAASVAGRGRGRAEW